MSVPIPFNLFGENQRIGREFIEDAQAFFAALAAADQVDAPPGYEPKLPFSAARLLRAHL